MDGVTKLLLGERRQVGISRNVVLSLIMVLNHNNGSGVLDEKKNESGFFAHLLAMVSHTHIKKVLILINGKQLKHRGI